MILDIIHYGDIQIEIRTSGTGSQRLFEYTDSLRRMEAVIEKRKPDLVVIPGDIFEFQITNGDETKLFGEHLNNITKHTKRVIIIPGNHDIRQRGIALLDVDVQRNLTDSIDSVVSNINNPQISYYDRTGFYDDPEFDIVWAVWSQRTKWNMDTRSPIPYSPWDAYKRPEGNIIELFHDPRQGCIGFNRKPSEHFEEYNITLDSFKANTVLCADIHAPEIIWFGEDKKRLFTYSSSLVMRNFGEGDYYTNTKRTVFGNMQHGYNVIEYDTENDRAISCKFHRLKPTVNRYTIRIDDDFNFDLDIQRLELDDPAPTNKVRIECLTSIGKFMDHQSELVAHLQGSYNIDSIEFTYGADVIEMDVEEGDENLDVTELVSKENLKKLSKQYIDGIVDRTKSIDDEDKDEAKELINSIFSEELQKIGFERNRVDITIHRLIAKNFMNFGTDVVVEFDNMGRITRIAGTNGLGKTTIFRAIKWALTDKIDAGQNDRNKRENYFAVFNDHSGLDEVFVSLDFSVNKIKHTVEKTLTREWKRGKSAEGNNMDDMRSTPTLTYNLRSKEFNSTNTEEVEDYLRNIITFDELDRLVFVNMDTLTDLIKMPSEDLGALILDEIGLNFVNDLLLNYDEVKDTKLDKLKKPKEDADVLLNRMTVLTGKVGQIEQELSEKKSEQEKISKSLEENETQTEHVRETLHKVDTVEIIENTLSDLGDELDDLQRDQNRHQSELDDKRSTVKDLDTLNDEKIRISGVIQAKKGEVSNNENTISNFEQNIESKKDDAKKLLAREKLNQENRISAEEGKISKLEQKISTMVSDLEEEKQAWKDKIQLEINTLRNANDELGVRLAETDEKGDDNIQKYNKLNLKKESLTKDISVNEDKVKNLENEKICPTCKQGLGVKQLERINLDVAQLRETIEKDKKLLDFATTTMDKLVDARTKINSEIDAINGEIKSNKTKIDDNQSLIDLREYPKHILDLDDSVVEKTQSINGEIQKIRENIESINKDIIAHVKDSDDYKEIIGQIQGFRSKIDGLKESNGNLETEIGETKKSLDAVESDISAAKKTNDEISKLIEKINEAKTNITVLESKIKEKQSDLKFAHLNTPILESIGELKDVRVELRREYDVLTEQINEIKQREHTNNTLIEQIEGDIEDARKYKVFSSSMKLYKKLLGKKGLPVYIFSHIIPMLNKKMNQLLDSVKFRLMFDKDTLSLKFYDIEKGVSRSVKFTSGMENTIIGLTLVRVIRDINNSKKFDAIFIDEISGKLNSGKDLDYKAPNYQLIVSEFLMALSKDMKVFIVDHVLELDNCDVISVYPDTDGSANVKVYTDMSKTDLKLLTADQKMSA